MELTILGSGCGIPSNSRNAPGIFIRVADELLLFDSGAGTLTQLLKIGVHYTNLNYVFYTHMHSDHVGDLIPLIQALWTTPDFKRLLPLHLFGPLGFSAFLKSMALAFGSWVLTPGFPLLLEELFKAEKKFNGFSVTCRSMNHGESANGYRIQADSGKTIAYSGDTDFNEEIISLALHADVLILECSFPERRKIKGHLVPREAGQIAVQAECKKLLLTHFYPPYEEIEDEIKSIIPTLFRGEVVIAKDLLSIKV